MIVSETCTTRHLSTRRTFARAHSLKGDAEEFQSMIRAQVLEKRSLLTLRAQVDGIHETPYL